jgi:EmrB/QacA subfamily drug resistance transporter
MNRWRGNPWAVLLTLSLGFFMTLLDLTVVNVAIPSMIGKLHASLDEMLWVINVYVLVLAALLIVSGRLGDTAGPRNLFFSGVALFTAASVLCGLAQSPAQLIVTRAVQGLGGAALVPQTMTIIIGTFPPARRGAALGVWGAVAGVATIAGPTLGGLVVSSAGWRWIFFINVPIGMLVLAMTLTLVPAVRRDVRHKLDLPGVVLAAATLFCLTFGLTEGQRYRWNGGIWALLAGAGLLLAVFLAYQRTRQHGEPLLPFALFRDRNFAVMNLVSATVQVGMLGLFLPMTLYLQSVLDFSAIEAGLVMAPAMAVSAVLSPLAGRLADRVGGKYILMTGLTLFAAGMAWLALVVDTGQTWYGVQPPLVVIGVGIGLVFGPMVTVAMYGVEPRLAGAASGVLNTIRQIGTVVGSAAVGAVLQNRLAVTLHDQAAGRAGALPGSVRGPITAAFAHGFVQAMRPTMALPVATIAIGAAACLLVRARHGKPPGSTPETVHSGTSPVGSASCDPMLIG